MMKHPKFIIENDKLILGKVEYHRHLATNIKDVKGGGWYEFDHNRKMFVFYGESFDFGSVKFDDIKRCIELKNVFETNLSRNIFNSYSFAYRSFDGELTILKQQQ